MKRTILTLVLPVALLAQEDKPKPLTADQKLVVREAQLDYAQLQIALDQAREKLKHAIETAEQQCGGKLHADLTCSDPATK
jgi:hypothetical protein